MLLPGFASAGGNPRDALLSAVLTDHVEIRARARSITADAPLGDVNELGELLAAHVRLEEEQLFPLIERTLTEEALADLGEELVRAEGVR